MVYWAEPVNDFGEILLTQELFNLHNVQRKPWNDSRAIHIVLQTYLTEEAYVKNDKEKAFSIIFFHYKM